MKINFFCITLLYFFNLSLNADEKKSILLWSISKNIKAPESCYIHKTSGQIFISQIGEGGGMGKDGDGWISKYDIKGNLIKDKWAIGLNAPKGIRSDGSRIWVTDIDRIVSFKIDSGVKDNDIKVENSKFLNDLACGLDGTVYFSDMIASKIYQYKNKKISILVEGVDIEHPNGLLVEGENLIIGAWGKEIQDDFTTKTLGRLLSLNLKTKKITPITAKPLGNLDGVESDGKGGYIVTDWIAGKVFHVQKSGTSKTLATFPKGAADHAFIADKKILILPEMLENKVGAFDLSPLIK